MNTMLKLKGILFDKRNPNGKAFRSILTASVFLLLVANGFAQADCTGSYQNNKPHGLWQCKDSLNQVISAVNYNEGVADGSYKDFYSNGQVRLDATYLAGKLNGIAKEYHAGGQLKQEGAFLNGVPVGIHKGYNESGSLINEQDFEGL